MMKEKVLDILKGILISVGIGAIVSTICMYSANPDPFVRETLKNTGAWLIASALYGLLSRVYDRDGLSLPAAMAIHMGGCLAITLATCWLLGYAEFGGNFFLAIVPVFLVIYLVIFAVIYGAESKGAREVNQKLR